MDLFFMRYRSANTDTNFECLVVAESVEEATEKIKQKKAGATEITLLGDMVIPLYALEKVTN